METNPSSSSSSSPPAKRFDVFLSFRGEDTRNNFTSHLTHALSRMGLAFDTFKDDRKLSAGKEIGPQLLNAIEDSHYAVVVLSEKYADSHWCLKELAKIVECMGDSGRIRTIFYHVDPSDVRNHGGSFGKALQRHEKDPRRSSEEVQSWRKALTQVGKQSGETVHSLTDEAIFIEKFVSKISRELGASLRSKEDFLLGMSWRLEKLNSCVLQSFETNNVCLIGIHGMGGIGKSTLAKAYYYQMSHEYKDRSFLQNVREVCEKKPNGLVDLQKKLLSKILKGNFEKIDSVGDGKDIIGSRLRSKRVLIVLDDVNEEDQLNGLAGEDYWFGSGSIIIVTTRDNSFLKIKKYKIYEAECLNRSESLQLFSCEAFGSREPPKDYKKLSEQVMEYASHLPLALTVLGSFLRDKDQSEWESALGRLRKCPEKGIFEKLKISFDDLNEIDQRIFLDIACFFNGDLKDDVIEILDSCGFDPIIGMRNLMNKSLLRIQHDGRLWMHDLLQDMGKNIVRKESGNNLGRQSRIWNGVDLYHVLENEEGTNEVEAIVIFRDSQTTIDEHKFEALSSMKNLRLLLLKFYSRTKRDVPKLKYLSNNLHYLEWRVFPYNKLPSSFQPRTLVQLNLRISKIEQLWNNCVKPLYNLKVIDLTDSKHFTKFEDFQVVPNLEKLNLSYCSKLLEIHPSIKYLKKLILLDLQGCTSLERLPEEINGLASLQTLNLRGCSKLEKLPDNLEQLQSLRKLEIEGCGFIEHLSSSINLMEMLEGCGFIKHLPSSINLMEMLGSLNCDIRIRGIINSGIREDIRSYGTTGKCFLPGRFSTEPESRYLLLLTKLDLRGCNLSGPEAFPEYFGKLVHLKSLDLGNNPFSILPSLIKGLTRLESLGLSYCKSLRSLEADLLPSSLQKVFVHHCTSLASFLDPSKPCHLRCSYVACVDCTELVKRQDTKMTALASLSRFLQDTSKRRDKVFRFIIPRSDNELPSWFPDQSSTASVSLKFDPNRCNSELIGIAMVFCFRAIRAGRQVLNCKIGVSGGKEWKTIDVNMCVVWNRTSDHLLLLYMPCGDTLEHIKNLKSGRCDSLDFYFLPDGHHECSYRPYGVRLVYEEDIEELKQITTPYINAQKDVLPSPHSQSLGQPKRRRLNFRGQHGVGMKSQLR